MNQIKNYIEIIGATFCKKALNKRQTLKKMSFNESETYTKNII